MRIGNDGTIHPAIADHRRPASKCLLGRWFDYSRQRQPKPVVGYEISLKNITFAVYF